MITWLLLALLSGMMLGLFDIFKKLSMRHLSVLNVLALYSLVSFLMLIIDYKEAFQMNLTMLPLIILKSFIIYVCWIMAFVAFKNLPISVVSPFKTLTPLFTICLSLVFFHEHINLVQGLGLALILIAYYLIARSGESGIKEFFKNKYLYLMVASAFLSSLSGMIDKVVLKTATPVQIQFWYMFFLMILYTWTFIFVSYRKEHKVVMEFDMYVVLTSLAILLSDRLYFMALDIPGSQLAVVTPIRFISILISVLLGGMIFREKNLRGKLIGIGHLLVGIILIFLS